MRDPAYAPMLATLGTPPSTGAGVATEVKLDGQRATVIVADGEVTVFSRNGADPYFPGTVGNRRRGR